MSETGLSAPKRRTVSKGIAWSLPLIAAASAAPFAAASPPAKCISMVAPSGNAPSCNSSASTSTKVAYTDDGNTAIRTLTHYIQFQVPAAVQVTAGTSVTFTYELTGVGTSWTLSAATDGTSGPFTWTVTSSGNFITVIATANQTVIGGNTVYRGILTATLPGVNNLNADSATFRMIASPIDKVSPCSIISPYGTTISFPKKYANSTSGLTTCRSGYTTRIIYFY
ncbi:hypothetical protein ACXA45_07680 [Neomicrococcus lactis]